MPAFHVSASTRINRPLNEVRQVIADFNSWPTWSPWLRIAPEASVEYHGNAGEVGHGYRWRGQRVGAGEMAWRELSDHYLQANLTFLKPFESKADVGFKLTDQGESTDVEWVMDSALPFFMFFIVKKMQGMITMDYSRGLSLLKDYIEQGNIACNIQSVGVVDSLACHYLGVSNQVGMTEIGPSIQASFGEVEKDFTALDITPSDRPLSVYHNMNIGKGVCHYTAAMPVSAENANTSGALKAGEILPSKAFKVVHTGPYRHVGNAWALAVSDIRQQKLKVSKKNKPYERYTNNPATTPENDLVTEIFIPLL